MRPEGDQRRRSGTGHPPRGGQFLASPADDTPPKRVADEHSLEARWVDLRDLDRHPLRGEEVRAIFRYVAEGGPAFPLDLLTYEGAPWRRPR